MFDDRDEEGAVWEMRGPDDGERKVAHEQRLLLRTAHILEQGSHQPGSIKGVLCIVLLDEEADPGEIFGDRAQDTDVYVAFFGNLDECAKMADNALRKLASS